MGTLTQNLADLKAFVHAGVIYAETNGLDKTLQDISQKNTALRKGDSYIYAYNYQGTCVAHGNFPEILLGKNFFQYKDQYGNQIVKMMIDIAKNGGGFAGYYFLHPEETDTQKQGDFKLVYVEPIPGTTIFLACDSWN